MNLGRLIIKRKVDFQKVKKYDASLENGKSGYLAGYSAADVDVLQMRFQTYE